MDTPVEYNIEWKSIDDITPYENNPRRNRDAIKYVANSIKKFGFKVPIVVDSDGVIVAGHTRLEAAKQIGLVKVPVITASDLSEKQIRAFRLADNRVGEFAKWDNGKLKDELSALFDFDMELFGFDTTEWMDTGLEETYTTKVARPQYEIKGEKPNVSDLYDTTKADEIKARINKAKNLPPEIKDFLLSAANRFVEYNFGKIAEFYAHSDSDIQSLIEDNALVVIDFDDAIQRGYVELCGGLFSEKK